MKSGTHPDNFRGYHQLTDRPFLEGALANTGFGMELREEISPYDGKQYIAVYQVGKPPLLDTGPFFREYRRLMGEATTKLKGEGR